jgi:hypothetical protein
MDGLAHEAPFATVQLTRITQPARHHPRRPAGRRLRIEAQHRLANVPVGQSLSDSDAVRRISSR